MLLLLNVSLRSRLFLPLDWLYKDGEANGECCLAGGLLCLYQAQPLRSLYNRNLA
jgi:hypothetical protein